MAAVESGFGRLDICVTNSGGPPSNSFKNTKPEDWRSAVEQLLMSTIFFARETLPRMQKNKWGRLITITSSAVKQPVDGLLLSNSVRAAVTGLARTLANEYAADGITVNNVCPGFTRTARLDSLASTISARTGAKPEEVFAGWEREIPTRRIGTPQEFAAVVAFLASERASYVTGVSIAVDPNSRPLPRFQNGRREARSFPSLAPGTNSLLCANTLTSRQAYDRNPVGVS